MGSVKMTSRIQEENLNKNPRQIKTYFVVADTMLDNRKNPLKMDISGQEETNSLARRCTNDNNKMNDTQLSFRPSIKEMETLIPIDYAYKDVTLPLIFVNKRISGLSIENKFY